jgi:hypothetical protein
MLAGLFSACGIECSTEDVKRMHPSIPAALEYGIMLASGLLERTKHEQAGGRLAKADDDHEDVVREDSMFAAHNSAAETRKEVDENLADFMYEYVGEYHTSPLDVYSLTMGEINAIRQGRQQAQERSESGDGPDSNDGRFADNIGDARNLPDDH